MPGKPATQRTRVVARLAATQRFHGPDDPRVHDLRRDLRAAELEEHITRLVDQAPPLTHEQVERLRSLLPPTASDGAA